jgi:cell division protein FtsL
MAKDWKDLTDDELLNYDEAHTAKMNQYDRIMSQKNIIALDSLRDKVTGLIETIYRASQGTQKKAEALIELFEKSAKSQNTQQKIIIALTIVIAISTILYTWITFQSVSAIRESNKIQIQMLELEKEKLKVEQKTKT